MGGPEGPRAEFTPRGWILLSHPDALPGIFAPVPRKWCYGPDLQALPLRDKTCNNGDHVLPGTPHACHFYNWGRWWKSPELSVLILGKVKRGILYPEEEAAGETQEGPGQAEEICA